MAKIIRKKQKIFAQNATNNGQFGSGAIGSKITSQDIDILQAQGAFLEGWNSATVSAKKLPTLEEMQALHYITTSQIAYLFQEGIAEWETETIYYKNSIVKKSGTNEIYASLTDDNSGNALTDVVNWLFLGDLKEIKNISIRSWDTSSEYSINDVVKEPNTTILYKSLTNNNLGNALTDPVNWSLLGDLKEIKDIGISIWNALTTYSINSVVKEPGTTVLYKSITNNNIGNALSDVSKWDELGDLASLKEAGSGGTIGEVKSSMLTLAQQQSLYGIGWVLCDGSSCVGSLYHAITGNTNVPDGRAAFLRGAGTSTVFAQNHTTTLGGYESDAIQGHKHSISDPSHAHPNWAQPNLGGGAGILGIRDTNNGNGYLYTHAATTGISVQNPTNDGANGNPRTANETRPNNLGVNFFIRIN